MPAGIYKRTKFHLDLLKLARCKITKDSIEKMKQSKVGRKLTEYQKQKLMESNIGKTISEEHKEALRKFHTGRKHSEATKEKLRIYNLGRKRPLCSGELHPFWKGGVTPIYKKIRKSTEYIEWRKSVFERDSYTCVIGGIGHGSKLQADHIKPFSLYPELRFDINNGRTLCIDCHRKTETYGGASKSKKY